MFLKWGYFSYRHRRIVPLVMIGVVLLLFFGWGTRLDDRMSQEGWEDPTASSTTAAAAGRPCRTSGPSKTTWPRRRRPCPRA